MPRQFTLLWSGLLAALLLAGCNRGGPALKYNQALVEGTQKLQKVGLEFGKAAGAALVSANDGDIARAEQAYQEMKKAVKAVQDEIKNLTVPPGQSAKELSEAFNTFLKQQEEGINREFSELMDVLRDKKSVLAAKQGKFNQILNKAAADEQASLATVNAAQRKFAQEHNITLKQ
jgi:hypothetical protein